MKTINKTIYECSIFADTLENTIFKGTDTAPIKIEKERIESDLNKIFPHKRPFSLQEKRFEASVHKTKIIVQPQYLHIAEDCVYLVEVFDKINVKIMDFKIIPYMECMEWILKRILFPESEIKSIIITYYADEPIIIEREPKIIGFTKFLNNFLSKNGAEEPIFQPVQCKSCPIKSFCSWYEQNKKGAIKYFSSWNRDD